MAPPHFHDLLNHHNSNFEPPLSTNVFDLEDTSLKDGNPYENSLHAYASASAYDYAAEFDDDSGLLPDDSNSQGQRHHFPSPLLSPMPLEMSKVHLQDGEYKRDQQQTTLTMLLLTPLNKHSEEEKTKI